MHQTQAIKLASIHTKSFIGTLFFALTIHTLAGVGSALAQANPPQTNQPPVDPPLIDSPQIVGAEAVGENLNVTVFLESGSPNTSPPHPSLDLVVTSPTCGELGRAPVTGLGSTVTIAVPSVLGSVLTCGTRYKVFLDDTAGQEVGVGLPFQISLRCNQRLKCKYQVDAGIELEDALLIPESLNHALTQATGSGDLVGSVMSTHPQLKDAVLTHALQLDRMLAIQGSGLTSSCRFQWTGSVRATGSLRRNGIHDSSVQACSSKPNDARDGSTSLTAIERWYVLGTGPSTVLALPGRQILAIPAFDRCSTPIGWIRKPVTYQLNFNGLARAGGDLGFKAAAGIHVGFRFDGLGYSAGFAGIVRDATETERVDSVFLFLDSGPVLASRATVFSSAEAFVLPTLAGPDSELPQLRAEAGGDLSIQANLGEDSFSWIRIWELGLLTKSGNDYPVEGEDPVACEVSSDET